MAAAIHQWATRIAGIDGGVGLEHRLIRKAGEQAIETTDDAAGHRLLEADRTADRHDLVAHA